MVSQKLQRRRQLFSLVQNGYSDHLIHCCFIHIPLGTQNVCIKSSKLNICCLTSKRKPMPWTGRRENEESNKENKREPNWLVTCSLGVSLNDGLSVNLRYEINLMTICLLQSPWFFFSVSDHLAALLTTTEKLQTVWTTIGFHLERWVFFIHPCSI